jgi:hypothetical protein
MPPGRPGRSALGFTDFDGDADSLSIGGLTIKQVPLPATALLLTGLGLIAGRCTQTARAAQATH